MQLNYCKLSFLIIFRDGSWYKKRVELRLNYSRVFDRLYWIEILSRSLGIASADILSVKTVDGFVFPFADHRKMNELLWNSCSTNDRVIDLVVEAQHPPRHSSISHCGSSRELVEHVQCVCRQCCPDFNMMSALLREVRELNLQTKQSNMVDVRRTCGDVASTSSDIEVISHRSADSYVQVNGGCSSDVVTSFLQDCVRFQSGETVSTQEHPPSSRQEQDPTGVQEDKNQDISAKTDFDVTITQKDGDNSELCTFSLEKNMSVDDVSTSVKSCNSSQLGYSSTTVISLLSELSPATISKLVQNVTSRLSPEIPYDDRQVRSQLDILKMLSRQKERLREVLLPAIRDVLRNMSQHSTDAKTSSLTDTCILSSLLCFIISSET